MRTTKTKLDRKRFDAADEVRTFDRGQVEVVQVAGHDVGRGTFEQGWRWSECVKPIAQTELCESEHLGYVISGRMRIRADDGTEVEFGPGDVMYAAPGHDAWVDEGPCVVVDFTGIKTYAKPT
jgi:uncharacterized cupin superfamily protein